jgi:hypothetical protein
MLEDESDGLMSAYATSAVYLDNVGNGDYARAGARGF